MMKPSPKCAEVSAREKVMTDKIVEFKKNNPQRPSKSDNADVTFVPDLSTILTSFDPAEARQRRLIARAANRTQCIHNWLRAHERVLEFRRDHEQNRAHSSSPELRFWYATPNRIVVGLSIVYNVLEDRKTSQIALIKSTGMARGTVSKILTEAVEAGMCDEHFTPSIETQQTIGDQIHALISHEEFTRFGASLAMKAGLAASPIDD